MTLHSRISTRSGARTTGALGVLFLLFSLVLLGHCAGPEPEGVAFTTVPFAELPGWSEAEPAAALPVLQRSCRQLLARPLDAAMMTAPEAAWPIAGVAGDWRPACEALGELNHADEERARRYMERWFQPLAVSLDGASEGLFTGYYEAELNGSAERRDAYQTPIHGVPDDLIAADLGDFDPTLAGKRIVGRTDGNRLVPFDTRAEIADGSLTGRAPVLLWIDDPVDAFFLHVQGSGRVIMDDGRVVRLGFAGRNGHAYTAIGRVLIERGALTPESVSMQSIRQWLADHPDEARSVLVSNASYIFFRVLDREGPVGAQGVVLTPGRSLAVDPAFIPLGAPLWLETTDPLDPARPLRRLVIAQDTGAAIKGPVRGDLFWGFGDTAAERAGRMRQRGRYYLMVPKTIVPAS